MKTNSNKTYWRAIIKTIFLLSASLLIKTPIYSQKILIDEDFTGYNLSNNLSTNDKWQPYNNPPTIIVYNSTPITYPGYSTSGGNYIKYVKKGEDTNSLIHYPLNSEILENGDILFFSFLLRVEEKPSSGCKHFISLGNSDSKNNFHFLRIFTIPARNGNLKLGLGKGRSKDIISESKDLSWSNETLNLNETYLVLIKYIVNPQKDDDEIYLWINPDICDEPQITNAFLKAPNYKDNILNGDNFDGIDLTLSDYYSPNYIIDGIKLTKGNISNKEDAWKTFQNIAHNTPPKIIKTCEDITVLENSPDTTISLREYFFDSEDNSSDLNFTITTRDPKYLTTSIDPISDKLTIDFNNIGTCENSLITVRATDSGGRYIEQSFYINIIKPNLCFSVKGTESIEETDTNIKRFTISKTGKTNQYTNINYSLSGTAKKGIDYELINTSYGLGENTINFAPNEKTKDISLRIKDDKLKEDNETIIFTLINDPENHNTEIIDPSSTKTIQDDDIPPKISPNQLFTLSELSPQNTLIGKICTNIPIRETELIKWSIVENINNDGDNINAFKINPHTGELLVNDVGDFNYSSNNKLSLQIQVSDGFNTSLTEIITIEITKNDEIKTSNILYVRKTGDDKNSGYNWNNSLLTIQAAINQATKHGNSEIWVAKGTYYPTFSHNCISPYSNNDNPRKKSFIIYDNLKLYGGFLGNETNITKRERKDFNNDGYTSPWEFVNETILSGDIGIRDEINDNSYHVIYCNECLRNNTEINGFTIANGNANSNDYQGDSGGGIFCGEQSNLTLINNIITNNTSSKTGGGIYCHNNNATIRNNFIKNNKSTNGGGISCNQNANISITNNQITQNISTEYGGGIYCSDKSCPSIINNIISGNHSKLSGGGIDCYNQSCANIINNTIVNNDATLFGGGIFCHQQCSPNITNTILWGNKQNNQPNQIKTSGSKDPNIYYSAIEGGFENYNNFFLNKNIKLDALNSSPNGPNFYDPEKKDYKIRINSTCKEKGNPDKSNLHLPQTDISGYGRILGTIDIGAFEFPLDKWPKASRRIFYGEDNSQAGINTSNIDKSIEGTFSFLNPLKKYYAGNGQKDTIIFQPNNKNCYSIIDTIFIDVDKATLTVIADNKSKNYRDYNPALSFKIKGFVNNEDSLVIDNMPQIRTLAETDSPVGNYPIILSEGHDDNYNFKYNNANLTITKQKPTIYKWPKILKEITYGQTLSETLVDVTNSETSVPGSFSIKEPNKVLNVGLNQSINVVFTPTDIENYDTVKKKYSLNINKAILKLSIEDETIFFKEDKPKFQIHYAGFQNNDNESIFEKKPVATIKGEWPLTIGEYNIEINLNEINLKNYKLLSEKGKLTIINNPPALVGKIPNIVVLENAENTLIDLPNYFKDIEQTSSELNYEITSDIPEYFNCIINSNNQLVIDYNKTGTGNPEILTIRATDKYGDFAEHSLTIEVNPGKVDFSVSGTESFEEGNCGTSRKSFIINKKGNTNQITSLYYEIKGNAEIITDYVKIYDIVNNNTKGKLTFKPKESQKVIYIDIKEDKIQEDDESIQLIIKAPNSEGVSTASISSFIATKTILNDDHSPEVVKDQSFNIDENSQLGNIVGKIEGTDVDDSSSLQSWEIIDGNTDNAFRISVSTGELIVNNSDILDKEKIDHFSLTIKVSDGFNYSKPEIINIELNDINDSRPIITPDQNWEVKEGTKAGTIIATVDFSDADITPSENYKWEIVNSFDSDNDKIPAVIVDPETGMLIIKDADEFDYEKNKQIKIFMTINDGLNTSPKESVLINIKDIQEASEISKISIYPNPARTFTIINSKEKGQLFVYNDSGKITINKNIKEGNNKIYLTNLSPGIYYFVIKLKFKTIEKTIIIE